MKKKILALLMIGVIAASITACGCQSSSTTTDNSTTGSTNNSNVAAAPDYSKNECWCQVPEISKDVDTFFVYPTVYSGKNEGDPDYASLDNAEVKQQVDEVKNFQASVFEESTNVFIPYYRQAGLKRAGEAVKQTGNIDAAISDIPYEDIEAALDYYFTNYNNGRPFILAGHSQGSAIIRYALKNYFKEHPEYYERMVAAYILGYSITKEDLESNPHMKFATGEDDAGVIISWNTEGTQNVEGKVFNVVVLPNAISINPLNWKLDETYAPASENKGSLKVVDPAAGKADIGDVGADAQINLERGVVVTNANGMPIALTEFFGPQSYHNDDYGFYYNNIKENVAKRIATYKASH